MNFRGQKIPPAAIALAVVTVVILTGIAVLETYKQTLPICVGEERPIPSGLVAGFRAAGMTNETMRTVVRLEAATKSQLSPEDQRAVRAAVPVLRTLPHLPISIEFTEPDRALVWFSGGRGIARVGLTKEAACWTSGHFSNYGLMCPPPTLTLAQRAVDYFDYVFRGGAKPRP